MTNLTTRDPSPKAEAPGDNLPARRMDIDTDALSRKALEMGAEGVEALKGILALAKEERDYRARCAYDDAMVEVQSEMPRVYKDGENTDNRSRFAKLEGVDRNIRPIYTRHGFRITFGTEPMNDPPGWIMHVATVTHSGGHVEHVRAPFPIDNKGPKGGPTKTEMHGVGSALTYAQRRLTCMAFGVVVTGEDNDAVVTVDGVTAEYVTDDQAAELRHLIELTETDEQRILTYGRCESLAEFPARRFEEARKAIRVTDEMAANLAALLEETETPLPEMMTALGYGEASQLRNLPAYRYAEAVRMLEAKR